MALTDDLKDYIARNGTASTVIKEKHNVAIVGETHALLKTPGSEIRTTATVRLLLELLADVKYKYFANESYQIKGKIRRGVEEYMRSKTLPPVFDPKQTDLDIEEIGERVLVRRYLPVLDYIRAHPRYILDIGSLIEDDGRDAALAQNFLDEFKARGLHAGDAGVLLLGAHHASVTPDAKPATEVGAPVAFADPALSARAAGCSLRAHAPRMVASATLTVVRRGLIDDPQARDSPGRRRSATAVHA